LKQVQIASGFFLLIQRRAEQLAIYKSTTADLDLLIVSGMTDLLIGLECSIMRKVYGQ